MSSSNETIIKFTMSSKSAKIFRGIVFTGVILGVIFTTLTVIIATSKPAMTEIPFDFHDEENYIFINLPVERNDKIYYSIHSNNEIDVRIMTDFEVSSWTQKDYHFTKDDEFEYKVKTTETHTIHVEYGEDPAEGTISYAKSGDNRTTTNYFIAAIFVSLFGGMIMALIYGGIADYNFRKKNL